MLRDILKVRPGAILDGLAAAEAAIARFDATAADADLRAAAGTLATMDEALASASMEGLKAMADAVFRLDADPHGPGQVKADRMAYDIRRAAASLGGLTAEADGFPSRNDLITLQDRATLVSRGREGDDSLIDAVDDDAHDDWRAVVEELADLPALLRLAVAVKSFEEMGVADDDSPILARLLVPTFLHATGRIRHPDLFVSPALVGDVAGRRRAWAGQEAGTAGRRTGIYGSEAGTAGRRTGIYGSEAGTAGRRTGIYGSGAWVVYFLDALTRSAEHALQRYTRFATLSRRFHEACPAKRTTSHLPAAVDWILTHPVFYAPDLARALGITDHGARKLIEQLRRARWVAKTRNPGGRFQIYLCDRVLGLVG